MYICNILYNHNRFYVPLNTSYTKQWPIHSHMNGLASLPIEAPYSRCFYRYNITYTPVTHLSQPFILSMADCAPTTSPGQTD